MTIIDVTKRVKFECSEQDVCTIVTALENSGIAHQKYMFEEDRGDHSKNPFLNLSYTIKKAMSKHFAGWNL
jgi:hypothetical protein